jgi:hypothetical protein
MEKLPMPRPGKILVLVAPRPFLQQSMPALIARLTALGPLRIVDGGNSFNAYAIARELRRQSASMHELLEQIHVARAFTCYQVFTLLSETPSSKTPTVCLDLLATFYDESVPAEERRRLLQQSIAHIQRLSQVAPVALSIPVPKGGDPEGWLPMLEEAAGGLWQMDVYPKLAPARLF